TRRIEESKARLQEFEEACERLKAEAAALAAEEESRRQAFAAERQRAFESSLAEAKEYGQRVEHEQQQRAAELELLRDQLSARSQEIVAQQQRLSAEIAELERLEAEQRERIHASEESIQAHRAALQAAEFEAVQRAGEEQAHLQELKAQIDNSEVQSQLKAIAARELRSQLETSRKAEAKQVKALQKLEERRRQAEATAQERSRKEAELLAELESIHAVVEQNERAWPETELEIKARIEALRKAETVQLRRVEKLMARLQAEQEKLAPARVSKGRSAKSNGKSKTATPKGKQWIEWLQALRSQTELELKTRSSKERQLNTELQTLHRAELEQLQRIEEAKARLQANQTALQAQAEEETTLLAQLAPQPEPVEIRMVEAVAADDRGSELSAAEVEEVEQMQPLETWQFAVADETEIVGSIEEAPSPANQVQPAQPEPETVEFEFLFNQQVEVAAEPQTLDQRDMEFDNQSAPVMELEVYEPATFDEPEKGIQVATGDSPVAALVEGLKSGDAAKRSASLRELATIDEGQAFRLITDLFDDDSEEVRNAAARALHEFTRDCAASFTRALREASPERRGKIAAAINGSGLAGEAIENLIGETREKTHDAFSMLFLMARAGEVQLLLRTIEQHPDMSVRLSVIRLLTFCNQPNIIPSFRSLAVRATLPTEIRSAIMEAIYQISSNARQSAA
ncbi:MAG TPA: HEAT repeat domain-containing protein, partial [Pyrinomonadaceae bacterium]